MYRLDYDAIRSELDAPDDKIIDGRAVAKLVRRQIKTAVSDLKDRGVQPTLVVVVVGDVPASKIYVRHKVKACKETGIVSKLVQLPSHVTQAQLHDEIKTLSDDPEVDGILVQFPLPEHIDELDVVACIDPLKDVDGFTPHNLGQLLAWRSHLEPCTPRGVMTLLSAYGIPIDGKRAVVVGRSMVVGRPMAQMLIRANATVTVCHRNTRDLMSHLEHAEIVVVATGVRHLIPGFALRPGAVVIDVGITRGEDGKLSGDVNFEDALEKVSKITPVPGGVGPMTVATLLENTVRATCHRRGIELTEETP